MRLIYFFTFNISLLNLCFSQTYIPIDTAKTDSRQAFIEDFTTRHKLNIESIKDEFSGDFKREMVKIHQEQFDEILKDFKKGEVYFDQQNQKYLQDLLNIIKKANPELDKKDINIHFSRDTNPNAFSIGDGNIVINIALLNTIGSEGELVSVICHEISHYVLKHREKSYKKNVENNTSRELKKEEREIKYQKYNRQKRAEEFIKNIVYNRKYKSRIHEIEADSLGNIFFNKTNYNSQNVVNLLKNLEKSDVEKDSLTPNDFKKYFTTKNQKFVDEWLEMEDFSKYKYSKSHIFKWNIDSLKTHPDCKDRISKIETYKNPKTDINFSLNETFFLNLKKNAAYENIFNLYFFKEYGYSLYETLKLLNKNKDDLFLIKMISTNLTELTKAKKEFKLNNFIPRIKPTEQTTSQQLFYNFMNNLTFSELQTITKDYNNLTQIK